MPKFTIAVTTNMSKGEVYDDRDVAKSRKEVARRIREHMWGYPGATSFVFTIARVGKATKPKRSNADE